MVIGSVIQFTEGHKWAGCFGFIHKKKRCGNDVRYMIGVPVPNAGIAYIFSMESAKEFEYVGMAVLVAEGGGEE